MIPFPNISPEIFSFYIGGFEIALRWYALSYIAGFILALFIMKFLIKREYLWRYQTAPMDLEQADTFLTYLILGVIVGGRLGYVFFYNAVIILQTLLQSSVSGMEHGFPWRLYWRCDRCYWLLSFQWDPLVFGS